MEMRCYGNEVRFKTLSKLIQFDSNYSRFSTYKHLTKLVPASAECSHANKHIKQSCPSIGWPPENISQHFDVSAG